jgi:transposase
LALVTVLQMAEDLTGRQAAEAVGERLSWQYALGLGLDDPGFDHSVLSEFRTRSSSMVWRSGSWTCCWRR